MSTWYEEDGSEFLDKDFTEELIRKDAEDLALEKIVSYGEVSNDHLKLLKRCFKRSYIVYVGDSKGNYCRFNENKLTGELSCHSYDNKKFGSLTPDGVLTFIDNTTTTLPDTKDVICNKNLNTFRLKDICYVKDDNGELVKFVEDVPTKPLECYDENRKHIGTLFDDGRFMFMNGQISTKKIKRKVQKPQCITFKYSHISYYTVDDDNTQYDFICIEDIMEYPFDKGVYCYHDNGRFLGTVTPTGKFILPDGTLYDERNELYETTDDDYIECDYTEKVKVTAKYESNTRGL